MVWLTGDWGAGKTHFAKNSLLTGLSDFNPMYISTIGVNNLNQFHDKLISNYYLGKDLSSNEFQGIGSFITKALSNIPEESSSSIVSIMQGFSGAINEKVISSISNVTLIIDDIERITNTNTAKEVLGECLNICENNKKVRIIVISDTKKVEIKKDQLEKYTPNKIIFTLNNEEKMNICFNEEAYFHEYKSFIEENISNYEFNNLRILSQIAKKITRFYSDLQQDELVDVPLTMEGVINDVFRVMHCHHIKGKAVEEIEEGFKLQSLRYMKPHENADIALKTKIDEFSKYYSNDVPSLKFMSYCCDTIHVDNTLSLYEPIYQKDPLREIIYSEVWDVQESQFENLIGDLKQLIFDNKKPEINKWFEACEAFLHLIEMEAVNYDKCMFINQLETLSEEKEFKNFNTKHNIRRTLTNETIKGLYNKNTEKVECLERNSEIEKIINNAKNSWSNVDVKTFQDYKFNELFFIEHSTQWKDMILDWSPKSIGHFSGFLRDRYIANSYGSIEQEAPTLQDMLTYVKTAYEGQQHGQKKAALKRLSLVLSSITT